MPVPAPKKSTDLVAQIDALIHNYGETNPNLHRDLLALQEDFKNALRQGQRKKAVRFALQIASLIKFLSDNWPDF